MDEIVRSTIGKRDSAGVVRHGGEWLALWADPDSVASPAERARRRAAGRERSARTHVLAATLRALAGGPAPDVKPVAAADDEPGWSVARGQVDQAGLRLRHHDPLLHSRLAPAETRSRALFDVLEQARVQALGVRQMPGIAPNLAATMAARLDELGLRQAHLAAQVPLLEALPILALDAMLDRATPLVESSAMEMWHRFAHARFGTALTALRPHLHDQATYAAAARSAVEAIFSAMEWDAEAPVQPPRRAAPHLAGMEPGHETGADEAGRAEPTPGETGNAAFAAHGYRRFSTAADLVVDAAAMATPDEMAALRARLDASMAAMRPALARLAHRLQRQLLAERRTAWDFDQEEGMLDTARLDRVVTVPGAALSYKRERPAAERDTVVSLLIDNSGSMRGRPITLAAMAADLAAQALERCGIATEILGFTTRDWRGGETARRWIAAGRPPHPGRICDLLHIVYKSASRPYRYAHTAIAVLLRNDLLRENVDGEALLWAAGRLRARPERRRLLVVISDGAPNDRATLDANDKLYLDRHLRDVVTRIEAAGQIELSAIGIGHPVDRLYRDAAVVASADGLAEALLSQIGQQLGRRRATTNR